MCLRWIGERFRNKNLEWIYFWVIWSHLIRRVLVMLMPFYHHCLTVVTIYNHICDHDEIFTYLTVISSRPLWTLADKGFWTLSPVQALGVAKCWLSSIWLRMRMMVIMFIDWWCCDVNANNDNSMIMVFWWHHLCDTWCLCILAMIWW